MPKFDCVIGNPPYLKGLHLKFLDLAIKCSKSYVCFIHPATWLINEKPNQRKGLESKLKNDLQSFETNINLYNGAYLFPFHGIGTYLTITYINKNTSKPFILVNNTMKNEKCEYLNVFDISKYGNSKSYIDLKNKILNSNDNLNNHRKENPSKKYVVNISQIRGHIADGNPTKVFADDFYTFIPKDKEIDEKITHDIYFSFDTRLEAINFIKYLKTDFARFSLSIYKINAQLIKGELASVPWLDFTQEWTDEKLYKYFNLTQEEIDFIEKNIPKYY